MEGLQGCGCLCCCCCCCCCRRCCCCCCRCSRFPVECLFFCERMDYGKCSFSLLNSVKFLLTRKRTRGVSGGGASLPPTFNTPPGVESTRVLQCFLCLGTPRTLKLFVVEGVFRYRGPQGPLGGPLETCHFHYMSLCFIGKSDLRGFPVSTLATTRNT